MTTATLAEPLLQYLEKHCQQHADECSLGGCVRDPQGHPPRIPMTIVDDCNPPRRVLRDSRCQSCSLVLTLQAVERNVSREAIHAWLDQPKIDLSGRTPRECLDAGDIEPVIDALWLLDQTELTDG